MLPPPPSSTLFPYTTLFRSSRAASCSCWTTPGRCWPGSGNLREWIRAVSSVPCSAPPVRSSARSEEHTSELQSRRELVCRLLLEKKKSTVNHNRDDDEQKK